MARLVLYTEKDNTQFVVETTNMDHTEAVDALGVTWAICGGHSTYAGPGEPRYERWASENPDFEEYARRRLKADD